MAVGFGRIAAHSSNSSTAGHIASESLSQWRKRFGDNGCAMEELVAELGAAFLSADLDLMPEVREDHASYLDHWLKVLKQDKRAIFSAASHAQRAARLNGLQLQKEARAA